MVRAWDPKPPKFGGQGGWANVSLPSKLGFRGRLAPTSQKRNLKISNNS